MIRYHSGFDLCLFWGILVNGFIKIIYHYAQAMDEGKRQLADVLHQEVEENSRNFNKLQRLKNRIQEELYS